MIEAAYARHRAGEIDHACRVYVGVLKHDPEHARALHYLGLAAQQRGQSEQAMRLLEKSIAIDSTDPRAHNHVGQIYLRAGRRRDARAAFAAAVGAGPDHVDSLNSLAIILNGDGERESAVRLYERILRLDPHSALACYNLAIALKELGRHDEAIALFHRAIAADPSHAPAHGNLAVCLEQKGRFAEAIWHYEAAIRINPSHVKSLGNLIAIREYAATDEMLNSAARQAESPGTDSRVRAKLHYALGKHSEKRGAHDQAFEHFQLANRARIGDGNAFDADRVAAHFRAIIETFDARCLASVQPGPTTGRNLIFIVGLPRSGTTLTEQILASHPQVHGAGELQAVPNVIRTLGTRYPRCVPRLGEPEWVHLRQLYEGQIDGVAAADCRYVTDKLPMNFVHLGLIAMLIPGARIVHCRRNPLDVGLSCFVEQFEMEQDFSTDLQSFGRYYLLYRKLMEHWRAVLPIPYHELQYEDLVRNQEAETRKLLAFCGLDWCDDCLRFAEVDRTVQTPSRWQVRQPVYRSSVDRWKNYEKHMEPLIRLLEKNGLGN